jgi:tetratricopeptide (TPR) repeat protein
MADLENFDGQELLDKVQEKYEANKNYVYVALAAIALIIGGLWWYGKSKTEKSLEANSKVWKPEFNFAKDSFNLAINGQIDASGYPTDGFSKIASDYSGTNAGQIALYSVGVSQLNLGNYQAAIDALEDVSFDDVILGAVAKGAVGDAYYELRKVDKAINAYEDAVSHSDNDFTTPVYLMKLASAQEDAKDFDDAIVSYKRIKTDFPASKEATEIDKYIARLEK